MLLSLAIMFTNQSVTVESSSSIAVAVSYIKSSVSWCLTKLFSTPISTIKLTNPTAIAICVTIGLGMLCLAGYKIYCRKKDSQDKDKDRDRLKHDNNREKQLIERDEAEINSIIHARNKNTTTSQQTQTITDQQTQTH